MISRFLLYKKALTTPILNQSNANYAIQQRPYAKLIGGKIVGPMPSVVPSLNNPSGVEKVQSDTSGFHKTIICETCRITGCTQLNCAHGCPTPAVPGQETQRSKEVIGALTHKVPPDKIGDQVDTTDFKGKNKAQMIVRETTAVPLGDRKFKEDVKVTEYVSDDQRFQTIIQGFSEDSVMKLQPSAPSNTPIPSEKPAIEEID